MSGLVLGNSSLEINLKEKNLVVEPGEHFILKFELEGLDDDNDIEFIDLYLLDLRENFELLQVKGENWEHEFVERYNDEHIYIRNARNESVKVHLRAKEEGRFKLQGYYQFMDTDGETIGLGDNQSIGPERDSEGHYFAEVTVEKKNSDRQAFEARKQGLAGQTENQEKGGLDFIRQNPLYQALNRFLAGLIA